MRLILLLILSTLIWCGEAATPPTLTPAAQKALDTYATKVYAEQQKFLAAVQKLQVECRRVLEAEQVALTKKGDLDGALAMKAKIEELQKMAVQDDVLGGFVVPTTPQTQDKALLTRLQAKPWVYVQDAASVFTFNKDLSFSTSTKYSGKYEVEQGVLTLRWSHGPFVEKFSFANADFTCIEAPNKAIIGWTLREVSKP